MNNIELLEKAIHYTFNNKKLLQQALTHKSANKKHNERFEFVGDAILNFIIANVLYSKFTKADEGVLTRMRALLVKEESLAELAQQFNLRDFLILGSGELKSGGFNRKSILSDAVEAIICAMYFDNNQNINEIEQIILIWFDDMLTKIDLANIQKDPKTHLQEYLQANRKNLPKYSVIDILGEDHLQEFVVSCKIIDIKEDFIGKGRSIRKAEQNAANQVLIRLGLKS